MNLRLLTVSITLIAFSFSSSYTVAKMSARVAVLPFEVYSDEGAGYLRNTIAKELSSQIATEEQIVIIDHVTISKLLDKEAPFNFNEFTLRKISEKLQTHFLVFGSLTKIDKNLSLDIYVFDSLGDPPFSKDFVEGNELNSLIREMARKVRAKVLLLASRYPEFQEPEIIAKATPEEVEEVQKAEEKASRLLPGDQVTEETLGEEIPETEAKEEVGEEATVAMLKRTEIAEVETQPKDVTKKEATSSPFASDKPVKITSNTLEADNKGNKVTFKGNVVAKQADMVIFSDLMTVKYENKGGIRRIEALGNVKMTQRDRIATGKKIIFYNPEQKIVMTGNPRIWQGDNLISCEKVTVLLKEDKIFFEGEVDSIIYPKGVKKDTQEVREQIEAIPTPLPQEARREGTEKKEEPASEKETSSVRIQNAEEKAIQKFILGWKHYWESKDLEKYMSCYSKEFSSRGMDWHQWKKHKKYLNDRYHQISLSLSDSQITLKDNQALVSFKQYYQSGNYADYGRKSLMLKKEGGDWKIFMEKWEPLPSSAER